MSHSVVLAKPLVKPLVTDSGEAGFIPTAAIFTATALVHLLSLIPILLTKRLEKQA